MVQSGRFGAVPVAPTPIVVTDDAYYYNTAFQIDATGEADGVAYLADESRHTHVLTLNGNAAIASERFVFDGTGDYIQQATTTSALWTPGAMTSWELFQVAFASNTTSMVLFANYRADNGGHGWRIRYEGTKGKLYFDSAATPNGTLNSYLGHPWVPTTSGARYDIALTWDRTTIRLYIDGIFVASQAHGGNIAQTTNIGLSVGCDFGTSNAPRNYFNGSIGAVRMTGGHDRTGGSVTDYTRHAVPLTKTQPALNDAHWGKVVFNLHGEGADGSTVFRDSSPIDRALTIFGAAQNDTAISVGDTPSILLGTNADYIEGLYGSGLDLLGLDFCFEAMVKSTDMSGWQMLLSRRNGTSHNFYFGINAGKFRWDFFSGSGAVGTVTGATTLAINTLYHLCAIRDAATNTLYLFVNGVLDASGVYAGSRTESTQPLAVGHDYANSTRYLRGSINHARMTVGAKRYNTAGFSVPAVPYAVR